jgi:hypothetical protein
LSGRGAWSGAARVGRSLALLLSATLVAACSFAWSFDEYEDGACPDDTKACDEECVPTDRADLGCGRRGCAACVLPHAVAICSVDGECAIGTCQNEYRDCDANQPGCETDTDHDPDHCGDCNVPCADAPNASRGCTAGSCAVAGCSPGFRDCNRKYVDGCEANLSESVEHCGGCDQPCAEGETCASGVCQ